jgi:signal transduction histidine kinase/CheY-like chemotaxis protein/HPt (histidine-containing phosphotransfer) domain-containing protein
MKLKTVFHAEYEQLVFVFFSFFFMVLISYLFTRSIVERYISSNAKDALTAAETKLQSQFRETQFHLIDMAFSIGNRIKDGQSNAEIEQYMADLKGLFLSEYKDMPGLEGAYGYIRGEFLDSNDWLLPADYQPQERPWYKAALASPGETVFTDPYISLHVDAWRVSVVKAIQGPGGEHYGVVSIDIDISNIAGYIKTLKFHYGGYGMLVGPDLTFLIHPDERYIGRDIWEEGGRYKEIAENFESQNPQLSVVQIWNDEEKKEVIFYRRIFNGWFLGMTVPKMNYYQDVYRMALILTALGLVLMLVLDYFLVRLTVAKFRSEEENKSKSSFLAMMSHEIRTPMNSIVGMSELLMRKNLSDEMFENVSVIRQAGNTLLAIINDILDFSKIESGHLQIEAGEYHFSSLVNDVINVIRERLTEKSLDFFVTVDGRIPARLIGDEVRVRQILINLLDNAVKYTHKGFISLEIGKENLDESRVKLFFKVSDSGIGISEENLGMLFNDFVRLDMKRTQGIEGTGLGLSITNALCKAMGGEILVSSKYNEGSVFTAVITQTFVGSQCAAQVDRPEQKRVLLYEDRPAYAASFMNTMKGLNVEAVQAANLQEFVKDLEAGSYNFAFVSSKFAMDCIPAWGKCTTPLELVIMLELGEVCPYQGAVTMLMPVYANNLANVLNGIHDGHHYSMDTQIRFAAPSARVLIVDDIATNLRVAAELMSPYKMHIDTCMSGPVAVDMVRRQALQDKRYDIIFMDHMMPGMDGIEATACIRAMEDIALYYRETPVVMLTANAISGQREIFLKNNVDDFLAKPIEMQKLAAILEKWIPDKKKTDAAPPPVNGGGGRKLPVITGINTQAGLANSGGSLNAYCNILSIFSRDIQDRIGGIRDAVEAGELTSYTIIVHALKSASRSIGALEIGDTAEELENAGKNQDWSSIKKKTEPFLLQMQKLTENITAALAQYAAERESAEIIAPSLLGLDALKEALIGMNIEAVDKLMKEYKAMSLDAKTKDLIDEIEQYILLFEYEKAITRIDTILVS